MSAEEIENYINQRNFINYKDILCTLVHTYKTKKDALSAIIEVSPELYEHVHKNNYTVFIGAQRCHAYDYFDLIPCDNCGRTGHNSKKCRNDTTCVLCSEKHKYNTCTVNRKNLKCSNCVFNNEKYNTTFVTNHAVNDTRKCEYLKRKIRGLIQNIDYTIQPIITRN